MTTTAPVSICLSAFCSKQTKVDIKNALPTRHSMTISDINVQAINMLRALKASLNSPHAVLERRLNLHDPNMSIANYWQPTQWLFCFSATFEIRLKAVRSWRIPGLHYGQPQKAPRLRQDLLVLGDAGTTITALPSNVELIANLMSSFSGRYGGWTGNLWNTFCAAITARREGSSEGRDAMLFGPNQTLDAPSECFFSRHLAWFGSNPVALLHTSASVQREVGTNYAVFLAHG